MDTGTITPLLKRLQASGMVTRTRDTADGRRVLVDLTEQGRSIEAEVRGINAKIKSACRLSEEDVNALRGSLEGLAHPVAE
jgi:DNA-binding MarR family transcriptional regulator